MTEKHEPLSLEPLESVVDLIATETNITSLTETVGILLEQVKLALPRYDASNYDENNISEAKADRATLNKFAKLLNDRRISIEREYAKPLAAYKAVMAETNALIKRSVTAIDSVIKGQEEKERQARSEMVTSLWSAQGFDVVPLHQVKKPEWLLKSTSRRAIQRDMEEIIAGIVKDMTALKDMAGAEDWPAVKLFYLMDLNLAASLNHAQSLKQLRNAPVVPPEPAPAPVQPSDAPEAPPVAPQSSAPPPKQGYDPDEVLVRTFRVTAPARKIVLLGNFMVDNAIQFNRIGANEQ